MCTSYLLVCLLACLLVKVSATRFAYRIIWNEKLVAQVNTAGERFFFTFIRKVAFQELELDKEKAKSRNFLHFFRLRSCLRSKTLLRLGTRFDSTSISRKEKEG